VKRRRIRERDEADAREAAKLHRDELLSRLRDRETARREPAAREPPETADAAAPEPTAIDEAPTAPDDHA